MSPSNKSLIVYNPVTHEGVGHIVDHPKTFEEVRRLVGVPPLSAEVAISMRHKDQGCGPETEGYWHGGVDRKGVHHFGITCSASRSRRLTRQQWIKFAANAVRLVLEDAAGTRAPGIVATDRRDPFAVLLGSLYRAKGSRRVYKEPVFIERHRREVQVSVPIGRWTRAGKKEQARLSDLLDSCAESVRGAIIEDVGVSVKSAEWTFTCPKKGLRGVIARVRLAFEGSPLRLGTKAVWRVAYSGTRGRSIRL